MTQAVVDLAAERRSRRPAGGLRTPFALVCSVVSGSVIDRLAAHMSSTDDRGAEVCAAETPEDWRAAMRGSRVDRALARARAFGAFPARLVVDALEKAPDALVVTTNPFVLPWVALLTRPLHGVPVVPLIYDLYPDALEATGTLNRGDLASRLLASMNAWMMRSADGVVFIGDRMAASARARYGEPRRSTVIEVGADPDEFIAEPTAPDELDAWMSGGIVASYVGNLGRVHDWKALADGLQAVRGVKVVIAASGPGASFLEEALGDCPHVRFCEPLGDAAWVRLLRRTDVALISLKPEANETSIPSKTFSALAAGCAICGIVPADSDVADVVADHQAGFRVEPGDGQGLRAALEALVEDPMRLARMQANARRAGATRYALRGLGQRFSTFVEQTARGARHGDRLKRAIDVAGAAGGLVVGAPVLGAACVAVALGLGRPVFFVQPRAGEGGQAFDLIKLRSMRAPRPGEEGPEHDGERMGRLGRFLRASSIDELPSLVNVLRGELSLVGPRPLLPRYNERYASWQRRRLEVKPGVTGWAQVNGRNALSWDEKFAHDVWYVDHRSNWLDAKIMLKTITRVLRRTGISQEGHASMPEFGVEAEGANA